VTRAILLLSSLALAGVVYSDLLTYNPYRSSVGRDFTDAWFFAPSVASPGSILALSALLLGFRARRFAGGDRSPTHFACAAAAGFAAATAVWAHLALAPRVLSLSLAAATLAGAALWFGRCGWRIAWPAALLLLLSTPIPGVLVQIVMLPLQLATAELTARTLTLLGFTASAIGDAIYTPRQTYQVIESCSGLRGIQSLAIGAFFVYLGPLQRAPRHSVALIASAVWIASLANLARCVSIVMNPSSELVAVHEAQGWTMFAAGAVGLALLDRLLCRVWPAARGPERAPTRGVPPPLARLVWLPCLLLVAAGAKLLPRATPESLPIPSIHDAVTTRLGPWGSEAVEVDRRFLGSVGFSERIGRRYRREGEPGAVDLFAGIDRRERPELSLLSPKTRVPGFGWRIERREPSSLPGIASAERLLLRAPNGIQWLGYHWTEGTRSLLIESLRAYLALDSGPLRRPDPALVVRLSTPVRSQIGEAEERIAAFLPEARRALSRLRPEAAPEAG